MIIIRVDILTEKECQAVRNALHGQYRIIFDIGRTTGLRVSDILKLKKSQLARTCFTVREQKTNKSRRIYMSSRIRRIYKDYKTDDSKAFTVSRTSVWRAFKRAGLQCGIKKNIGTHTMRKSYAVHHTQRYGLYDTQKRLNHTHINDTINYTISNDFIKPQRGRKGRK